MFVVMLNKNLSIPAINFKQEGGKNCIAKMYKVYLGLSFNGSSG